VSRLATIHVLTIAYVLALVVGLGMPLRDSPGVAAGNHQALALEVPPSLRGTARDLSLNIILFVPLGVLGRRSLRRAGVAPLPTLLVVVGGSLALSLTMETLQHFIPGRFSSLVDVMMNGGGAMIAVAGDMAADALSRLRG
jgi:glycopeptide antibiotics resistance protein